MAVANLVRRGEEAFVCRNGYFSDVIAEMIHAYGGIPVPIQEPKPQLCGLARVGESGHRGDPERRKVLFVVHNETSTGAVNPAKELLAVCHDTGVVSVLDAISSFGGMDVRIDEWKADFCVGYASKGLGAVNGVVPVSIGDECWEDRQTEQGHYTQPVPEPECLETLYRRVGSVGARIPVFDADRAGGRAQQGGRPGPGGGA